MAYEVLTPWSFFLGKNQYIFESFEEIAAYYSYEIFTRDFGQARIIDCYDRQRVDPSIVISIAKRIRDKRMLSYYRNRYGSYNFRDGPVPGIGKGRSHRGSYYRRPKTFSRRREIFSLDTDADVKYYNIKIKRSDKQLPTSWDDIRRSDRYDRNWKRFRDKQYKMK